MEKRRGRGAGRGRTSPAFLIAAGGGGVEAVSRALGAADGVGDVAADVAADLFAGRLYAPNGPWALLVQLRGQRWVILTRSRSGGIVPDDWERQAVPLSGQLGRPVIAADDDGPGYGARFVLADAGKTLIDFVSDGEKFSLQDVESGNPLVAHECPNREIARVRATRFESDRHDADWWRGRKPAKSLDLLLREANAYLPFLKRGDNARHAELYADDDVLAGVERIDLVAFGPKGRARARPTDVDLQLTDGIQADDPAAVVAALAAGADPDRPPGVAEDGLEFALSRLKWGQGLVQHKLAVVELLLAAGAGGARLPADAARRDAWWRERKREELTALYRQRWTINGDEPELDLPASRTGEPVRVTVEPRAFKGWSDARWRDSEAADLEALGFARVGEFAVLEAPAVRMLVLHHHELRAFAVISELAMVGWAEVVRWHGDGSSLSVSNAPLEPQQVHDTPAHRKVVRPGWDANQLVEIIRTEPPPETGVRLIEPADFKRLFEEYFAAEMAARRQGRVPAARP